MRALLFSALTLLVVGCSSSDDSPSLGGSGGFGAVGGTGSAGNDSGATSLKIQDPEGLEARAPVTITVRALPPGVYPVQFALPSTNGDPLDAVLDRSEGETDADGYAYVELTAPSRSEEPSCRER